MDYSVPFISPLNPVSELSHFEAYLIDIMPTGSM